MNCFNFLINYKGSISESENEYIGGVELFIAQSSSFVHREGSNLQIKLRLGIYSNIFCTYY